MFENIINTIQKYPELVMIFIFISGRTKLDFGWRVDTAGSIEVVVNLYIFVFVKLFFLCLHVTFLVDQSAILDGGSDTAQGICSSWVKDPQQYPSTCR